MNHLYGGMDEPELKIIDVFVCKLRKKLFEATGEDSCIQMVWGRGYVLKDPLPDMATQNRRRITTGLDQFAFDPSLIQIIWEAGNDRIS